MKFGFSSVPFVHLEGSVGVRLVKQFGFLWFGSACPMRFQFSVFGSGSVRFLCLTCS